MLMLKHLMQQVYSFVCLSTFLNNKRDTTIINFIITEVHFQNASNQP
jgi:hypothetical protein